MSTTPSNFDRLNPLQKQAAKLLGEGASVVEVRERLALSVNTFEGYRADPIFDAAVTELKLETAIKDSKAAASSEDDFDAAIEAMS